jgi:uncharacterized protein YggE
LDFDNTYILKVVFDVKDSSITEAEALNFAIENANEKAKEEAVLSSFIIKDSIVLSESVMKNPFTAKGMKTTNLYYIPKSYTNYESIDTDLTVYASVLVKYELGN